MAEITVFLLSSFAVAVAVAVAVAPFFMRGFPVLVLHKKALVHLGFALRPRIRHRGQLVDRFCDVAGSQLHFLVLKKLPAAPLLQEEKGRLLNTQTLAKTKTQIGLSTQSNLGRDGTWKLYSPAVRGLNVNLSSSALFTRRFWWP